MTSPVSSFEQSNQVDTGSVLEPELRMMLMGMLGHRLNNILAVILGNISLVQSAAGQIDCSSRFELIEQAIFRAREIANQLQLLSGEVTSQVVSVELMSWLREQVTQAGVACEVAGPTRVQAELDIDWIGLVFQGVLSDAGTAVSAISVSTDEGQLSIRVELSTCSTPSRNQRNNRLLWQAILSCNHGNLTFESTPKSEISLFFPVDRVLPGTGPVLKKRVLVMDDEEALGELLEDMLGFLGHDVVRTLNGDDALQCFQHAAEEGSPFDLVILDLWVPNGLGGAEVLPLMRQRSPDLRAIVSSGYWEDATVTSQGDQGFHGALAKPFSLDDVKQVLEAQWN